MAATTSDSIVDPSGSVERRVAALLEVARIHRAGIPFGQLIELLQEDGPSTPEEVEEWFRRRPSLGRVEGGIAYSAELEQGLSPLVEPKRQAAYLRAANRLFRETLSLSEPLVVCAAVSGSTAYGEPTEDADVDLFVVTRPGTLWFFLVYAFLTVRFRNGARQQGDPPVWCFNYVIESSAAEREFRLRRGFLVAREALTLKVIKGDRFLRHLLAQAAWMREEAPRLHARWQPLDEPLMDRSPPRTPLALRAANLALYPLLAAYLHLTGMVHNRAFRRTGQFERLFRTSTGLFRFAVASVRFDQLSQIYDPLPVSATNSGASRAGGQRTWSTPPNSASLPD